MGDTWIHEHRTFSEYNSTVDPAMLRLPTTGCADLTPSAVVPDDAMINDPEHVRATAAAASGLWEAGANRAFDGMTFGALKAQLMDVDSMSSLRLPLGPGADGVAAPV